MYSAGRNRKTTIFAFLMRHLALVPLKGYVRKARNGLFGFLDNGSTELVVPYQAIRHINFF